MHFEEEGEVFHDSLDDSGGLGQEIGISLAEEFDDELQRGLEDFICSL